MNAKLIACVVGLVVLGVVACTPTLTGYYKGLDYLMQNPDVPDMYHVTNWTTGEQRFAAVNDVMSVRAKVKSLKGDAIVRNIDIVSITKLDGVDTATAKFCLDLKQQSLLTTEGEARPMPIPTFQTTATVVSEKGKWKISSIQNKDATC